MSPKNKSELFSDITSCQLRIYERGPTSQEMLWAIKIASHCHLGIYDLSHWSCHAHSHPSSVQTICRNAIRTEHLSSNISNKAFWEPFCSTKITRKMSVLLGEYLSSSSLFPQHSPKCPICNPYAVGIHAGTKNQGPPSRFYQAFWSNKVSCIWWSASKADGLDHHQLQEFKTWSQRAAKKKMWTSGWFSLVNSIIASFWNEKKHKTRWNNVKKPGWNDDPHTCNRWLM